MRVSAPLCPNEGTASVWPPLLVLQDDGLTGAGGQDGHSQGPWGQRQLDPDGEVGFPGRPPHLRLGEVFPQGPGADTQHRQKHD